jgi:glutathione S-transferase
MGACMVVLLRISDSQRLIMTGGIKLWTSPGYCSLAVHICLREGEFSDVEIVLVEKNEEGVLVVGEEPLRKVNPLAQVPAIQIDDGDIMIECPVINMYLQSVVPEKLYFPNDADKWKALAVQNFISSDLHQGIVFYFRPYVTPESKQKHLESNVMKNFNHLNNLLQNSPFLFGNKPSIVDFYAYVVVTWAFIKNIDISSFKNIAVFGKRIESRPAVKQALKEEGLSPYFS